MIFIGIGLLIIGAVLFFTQRHQNQKVFSIKSARAMTASELTATAGAVAEDTWEAPRLPWGDPDLQGIWTNAMVTTLHRPDEIEDLVLTEAQAQAIEVPQDSIEMQLQKALEKMSVRDAAEVVSKAKELFDFAGRHECSRSHHWTR